MSYAKDLVGKRFGRLVVLSRNYEKQESVYKDTGCYKAYWNCKCDCGNVCIVNSSALTSARNSTKSCGCLNNEQKHKQKNTKTNTWVFDGPYAKGTDCHGNVFIIDKEDYDKAKDYCWRVSPNGYVIANARGGSNRQIWLHRLIMSVPPNLIVDHINWDKQDNRKCNLRLATKTQNNINIKRKSNNKTGYTGVSYQSRIGKYRAAISINGKKIFLGNYANLQDAIDARHKAELVYHGSWSGEINRRDYNNDLQTQDDHADGSSRQRQVYPCQAYLR